MKTRTLRFTVTGSFLTRHVRDLWTEGRYELALDMLDCLDGLTPAIRFGVIRGTWGLTDDSTAIPDDWKPDLSWCHLRQYPDPERLAGLAEQGVDLAVEVKRLQDLVCSLAVGYRRTRPIRAVVEVLEDLLETLPDEVLERNGVSRRTFLDLPGRRVTGVVYGSNEEGWTRGSKQFPGWSPAGVPKVEDYIERQLDLDKLPCPDPEGVKTSDNGYITPDGAYYPCRWMEHNWLADRLKEEREIDEAKLIKVANSQINPEILGMYLPSDDFIPTPRQYETALAWCLAWHAEIPSWLREGEGKW